MPENAIHILLYLKPIPVRLRTSVSAYSTTPVKGVQGPVELTALCPSPRYRNIAKNEHEVGKGKRVDETLLTWQLRKVYKRKTRDR